MSVQPLCAIACISAHINIPNTGSHISCLNKRNHDTLWKKWVALLLRLLFLTQVIRKAIRIPRTGQKSTKKNLFFLNGIFAAETMQAVQPVRENVGHEEVANFSAKLKWLYADKDLTSSFGYMSHFHTEMQRTAFLQRSHRTIQ